MFFQKVIAFIMSVITFITGGIVSFKKDIKHVTKPTLYVSDVKIGKNENTATVNIYIVKNPGIAGAKITIAYDSELTLQKAETGAAFSPLQYTKPGRLSNPCSFTWDSESGMANEDGVIITLIFSVSSDVKKGEKLAVSCSYQNGDIYDENLEDVSLDIINGFVYIK